MRLSDRLASALLRLVRLYTHYFPLRKGKYRLIQLIRRAFPHYSSTLRSKSLDGRSFDVDLSTGMYDTLYFLGEYETFITSVIGRIVSQGDVCVDAGANFGWYSTFLADRVGSTGRVHAFEPVPSTFEELRRNISLNDRHHNVITNKLALSDTESEAVIMLFDGHPSGHASLIAKGKGLAFGCRTTTIDAYLQGFGVGDVSFLKVDVEGSELRLLQGASRIFAQTVPPLIVIEMALEQSKPFGYAPKDLIEFVSSKADYRFFKFDEINFHLIPLEGFTDDDIGANVLCIPENAAERIWIAVQEFGGF
ncbi:MAG TPA: FkbM family methyltransferase [Pyrinomonadaceae bacterium]